MNKTLSGQDVSRSCRLVYLHLDIHRLSCVTATQTFSELNTRLMELGAAPQNVASIELGPDLRRLVLPNRLVVSIAPNTRYCLVKFVDAQQHVVIIALDPDGGDGLVQLCDRRVDHLLQGLVLITVHFQRHQVYIDVLVVHHHAHLVSPNEAVHTVSSKHV